MDTASLTGLHEELRFCGRPGRGMAHISLPSLPVPWQVSRVHPSCPAGSPAVAWASPSGQRPSGSPAVAWVSPSGQCPRRTPLMSSPTWPCAAVALERWLVRLRSWFLISVNAHLVLTDHVWPVAPERDRKPQGVDRGRCEWLGSSRCGARAALSLDIKPRTFVLAFSKQLLSTYCTRAPRSTSPLMQVRGPPRTLGAVPAASRLPCKLPGVTPLYLCSNFPRRGHLCSPFL